MRLATICKQIRHHYYNRQIDQIKFCQFRSFSVPSSSTTVVTTDNHNRSIGDVNKEHPTKTTKQTTVKPRRRISAFAMCFYALIVIVVLLNTCLAAYYYYAFYIARSIEKGLYGSVNLIDMDEFVNDLLPSGKIETIVLPVLPDEKYVGIILSPFPTINGKIRSISDYLLPINDVEEFKMILAKLSDDEQLKSSILPFEMKTIEQFRYRRVLLASAPLGIFVLTIVAGSLLAF